MILPIILMDTDCETAEYWLLYYRIHTVMVPDTDLLLQDNYCHTVGYWLIDWRILNMELQNTDCYTVGH